MKHVARQHRHGKAGEAGQSQKPQQVAGQPRQERDAGRNRSGCRRPLFHICGRNPHDEDREQKQERGHQAPQCRAAGVAVGCGTDHRRRQQGCHGDTGQRAEQGSITGNAAAPPAVGGDHGEQAVVRHVHEGIADAVQQQSRDDGKRRHAS